MHNPVRQAVDHFLTGALQANNIHRRTQVYDSQCTSPLLSHMRIVSNSMVINALAQNSAKLTDCVMQAARLRREGHQTVPQARPNRPGWSAGWGAGFGRTPRAGSPSHDFPRPLKIFGVASRVMGKVATDRVARYLAVIGREAETLEELAVRVAEGEGLAAICKEWDIPYGRFATWIASDAARNDLYENALRLYTDAMAFEARDIADRTEAGQTTREGPDGAVVTTEDMLGHRKLRVDTRMRLMAKWHRARYGDSVVVQHQGETVVRLTFGGERAALTGSSSVVDEEDVGI